MRKARISEEEYAITGKNEREPTRKRETGKKNHGKVVMYSPVKTNNNYDLAANRQKANKNEIKAKEKEEYLTRYQ